ncbi:hypothetical protein SAMN05444266_10758 [Chitinophaga jiangningensis]|uniref:Uncharacterized protein n=1 Tax=Chitinophaga jiangningensis TaxID=1419482 RepID=A0A1M7H369_9BACT|nr:hypothetical protein [Chitinophaga jiangningensis]SHM22796.1 hypothetical protein SAMN05444266_10758 [Chitinophaga jiangningensis]
MIRFTLFLLFAFLWLSCGQQQTPAQKDTVILPSFQKPNAMVPLPRPALSRAETSAIDDSTWRAHQPDLQKAKIHLLSFRPGWNNSTSTPPSEFEANRKWRLDSLTILKLLHHASPTDDMALDLGPCSFLPGTMEGNVMVNDTLYHYMIDAGGYMYLGLPEGDDHYCYCWYDKALLQHFLDIPDYDQYID